MRPAPIAVALSVAPAIAEACPACAGRGDGGALYLALLGSFILLPFAIVKIVHRAIRTEERRAETGVTLRGSK